MGLESRGTPLIGCKENVNTSPFDNRAAMVSMMQGMDFDDLTFDRPSCGGL